MKTVVQHAAGGLAIALVGLGTGAVPASADGSGGACNASLVTGTLTPFTEYMNQAHLERSPLQQVRDAQDPDTYIRTHTILAQNMSEPLWRALFTISDGSANPLLVNVNQDHFERSPSQQVGDMAQADSYVKQHTVLVEHVLQPVLSAVSGDC
ncbi:MAG TPA: hypothetical protein VGL20_17715 [Candidatus Dormibacteraeota bacterium]|jgi:hypothetical protein